MNIAVATAITAAVAAALHQVARADLLPQAVTDRDPQRFDFGGPVALANLTAFGSERKDAGSDLLPFGSDGAIPFADLLQFNPNRPVASADLQWLVAFSYSHLNLDSDQDWSFDNAPATYSPTEMPQPVSLEVSKEPDVSVPARDPGLLPGGASTQASLQDTVPSPGRELGVPTLRIQFGTPALAPMAHTFFCLKYPDECKVEKTALDDGAVALTAQRWAELVRVNASVNRAIIPQPNTRGLAGEKWLISPRAGECHDYAVTKRHELLALGWPESDLLLSEVVTSWGEHHLVLVVRTSEGDFVADNLNPNIRIWTQVPYQWVRIQSAGNPMIWSTMVGATVSAKTSGRLNHS